MAKLRVHNLSVSVDGYAAGPDQDLDNPLGVGGERLHEWVFKTRYGRRMIGEEGGDEGLDDEVLPRGDAGIVATVTGRNMSGPIRRTWPHDQRHSRRAPHPPPHHPLSH